MKLKLFTLVLALVCLNAALFLVLPRYRFRSIVVHHSAGTTGNYASIRDQHARTRGWRDAGYHLILSNGSTSVPAGHLEATGRYHYLSYSLATRSIRHNLESVHICVIGNYEHRALPDSLKPALAHALISLQKRYRIPRDRILLHRDVSPSLCPGRNITRESIQRWTNLAGRCPESIRRQQERVIGNAWYSIYTLPSFYLLVAAAASVLLIMVWLFPWRRSKGKRQQPARTAGKEVSAPADLQS